MNITLTGSAFDLFRSRFIHLIATRSLDFNE